MPYQGDTTLTRFLAEQTLGQLREMKSAVRTEIESARARVAELEDDLARIDAAINEKSGGRGRATSVERNGEPTTGKQISLRQAILSIMRDAPRTSWTTQDMLDELRVRSHAPGGKTPLNTVGSRMIEMSKSGLITRMAPGRYVAQPAGNGFQLSTEDGDRD